MRLRVIGWVVLATSACGERTVGDGPEGGEGTEGASSSSGSATSSDGETEQGATSSSTSESSEGGSTGGSCVGSPHDCVEGSPSEEAIACGDVSLPAECVGGRWTCGAGQVVPDQCVCYYLVPRPVCLFADNGTCSDIIVPAVCEGTPGDGDWTCPPGTLPEEECDFGGSSSGSTG